jgi:hypothetical protein
MDVLAGPRAKQESAAKWYRLGRLASDGVMDRQNLVEPIERRATDRNPDDALPHKGPILLSTG